MGLGAKLALVSAKCRYMTKDGRNEFQKYDYVTAASLLGKVNEALTEQKLYISQTKFDLIESRDVTTSKGNTEKYVLVKVSITISDSDEPKESVTFEGFGSGQDAGDKAVMKSNTAALKYAWVGGLAIAMGDDPEQDSPNYFPDMPQRARQQSKPAPPPKSPTKPSGDGIKCAGCGKPITDKVADYSQKKFGKPLCFDCQKKG